MSRRERWDRSSDEIADWLRPRRRWHNPFLFPWRWRYELGTVVAVGLGARAVARTAYPGWITGILVVIASAASAVPRVRRFVGAQFRAVLTQHRLRAGMVGSGVLSWSGYLPAILWTRPTHEGIHMHVWCPAGVDEHTFRRAGSRLAAACWASDVRVEKHPRWSQILVLVIATGRRGTTPPDLRAPGTGQ